MAEFDKKKKYLEDRGYKKAGYVAGSGEGTYLAPKGAAPYDSSFTERDAVKMTKRGVGVHSAKNSPKKVAAEIKAKTAKKPLASALASEAKRRATKSLKKR